MNDIRWIQRFQNFSKAIMLLKEIQELKLNTLSSLEKEGIIQRFEFTLELAWKTLKDKMEFDGLLLDKISPKMVLKEAFNAKYINEIEVWLKMIDDRNILTHTYDITTFEKMIPTIQTEYVNAIYKLYMSLNNQVENHE